MIRRAIVEQVVSPFRVKVRIPEVDRAKKSSQHISNDELDELTVCVPAGWHPNFQIGDIVIVSYDIFSPDESVIIGFLYKENLKSISEVDVTQLIVSSYASLPQNTTIGNVTAQQLQDLTGVRDNIQKQLDSLQEQINQLQKR